MDLSKLKLPAGLLMVIGIALIMIDHLVIHHTTVLSYIAFFGVIGVPFLALIGYGIYKWVKGE